MAKDDFITKGVGSNFEYRLFSKEEENFLIKKSKLSFYTELMEDMTDEEKLEVMANNDMLIDYYSEDVPEGLNFSEKVRINKLIREHNRKYGNVLSTFYKNKEEIPSSFREAYDSASLEEKEELLEAAIEDSKLWCADFMHNYQRWVFSIAAKCHKTSLSQEALEQEGNIGMLKAIEKFDFSQDNKFLSYATWWIKQVMYRSSVVTGPTIRIPVYFHDAMLKVANVESELSFKLRREPSLEEIAEASDISVENVEAIKEYMINCESVASLNKVAKEDSIDELESFIPDSSDSFTDGIEMEMILEEFKKALEEVGLKGRDLRIIYDRFGFNGESKKLSEIGKDYGISRERVRQIEASVLEKLRKNKTIRTIGHDLYGVNSGKTLKKTR